MNGKEFSSLAIVWVLALVGIIYAANFHTDFWLGVFGVIFVGISCLMFGESQR